MKKILENVLNVILVINWLMKNVKVVIKIKFNVVVMDQGSFNLKPVILVKNQIVKNALINKNVFNVMMDTFLVRKELVRFLLINVFYIISQKQNVFNVFKNIILMVQYAHFVIINLFNYLNKVFYNVDSVMILVENVVLVIVIYIVLLVRMDFILIFSLYVKNAKIIFYVIVMLIILLEILIVNVKIVSLRLSISQMEA